MPTLQVEFSRLKIFLFMRSTWHIRMFSGSEKPFFTQSAHLDFALNNVKTNLSEVFKGRVIKFMLPCQIMIIAFWNDNDHSLPGAGQKNTIGIF